MSKYRKLPIVIEATQWFKNGDHPLDGVGQPAPDPAGGPDYTRIEGRVVRFFRRPEPAYAGMLTHFPCGNTLHDHGFIETHEGGHMVCPGDWIITDHTLDAFTHPMQVGSHGHWFYPCKPDIFAATYEVVAE